MSDYKLVQLDVDTLKYLPQLYESVYKKRSPANFFQLKYDTQYTGQQYLGYFAFWEDMPVAFYGVIPVKFLIRNETVLGAQSCDTMTHSSHRKKGLFIKLAKMTFDLAKEKNIHFIFGFPNKNSYTGFVEKLGFLKTETMNRYTLKFTENWFKKVYRKLFFLLKRNSKIIIKNKLLEQGFDGVIYDEEFIQYKKYNKNTILCNGENVFWLNTYGNMFLGALEITNEKNLKEQLHFIEKKTKAASLTLIISRGTLLDEVLSTLHVAEEGFPVIMKDLSGKFFLNQIRFQFADIDIF